MVDALTDPQEQREVAEPACIRADGDAGREGAPAGYEARCRAEEDLVDDLGLSPIKALAYLLGLARLD